MVSPFQSKHARDHLPPPTNKKQPKPTQQHPAQHHTAHTNRSAKQMPTMKTSKCYIKKAQASTTTKTPKALLTARNARNLTTTPKRLAMLAKTKVTVNSPQRAKEKITLDRHRKVTRAALWNHLQITINQAHKD